MHGEFKFPTERFDNVGGCDFIAVRVVEGHFDVGTFLKGGDLDVDVQAVSIGIGLGRKSADPCFFRNSAGEVIFGEEKVHCGIIPARFCRGLVLGYSFISLFCAFLLCLD